MPKRISPNPRGDQVQADMRISDVLRQQAGRHQDRPVCVVLDRDGTQTERLTYGDLDLRARAVAAELQRAAVPGDRALLVFSSGADFLVALFACAYANVIAVPVPGPGEGARSGLARVAGIMKDAAPRVVLTTAEIAARPEAYGLGDTRVIPVTSVRGGLAGCYADPGSGYADPGHDPRAIAWLQYTSGSTSEPKGVQVSHRNVLTNLKDLYDTIPLSLDDGEGLRIVSWLPHFHDMGLLQLLLPLLTGGQVVIISPISFLLRPVLWMEAIARFQAHLTTAPNFGYDLCARRTTHEQTEGLDLSCLRFALNGSETVRAQTLDLFARRFAPAGFDRAAFVPCYGLAETAFYVSGALGAAGRLVVSGPALEKQSVARPPAGDEPVRDVVSCGPVPARLDVRIVDPVTFSEREAGAVGEIWVAGQNVSAGYWQRDDGRFGARLADGPDTPYVRTRDLGFRHDGELYLLGRLDDVIVLDGRNHYPQDIELTAQLSHGALAPGRVAAFGYERDAGTAVVIVAETALRVKMATPGQPPEPGQLDAAEVVRAVRAAVSAEHQIRVADVILLRPAGLPRTTSGKVRRRRCRELFLAAGLKTW
jgi:acyl-CoA synthetase (AMP-forming)/AMP-acid ligase II